MGHCHLYLHLLCSLPTPSIITVISFLVFFLMLIYKSASKCKWSYFSLFNFTKRNGSWRFIHVGFKASSVYPDSEYSLFFFFLKIHLFTCAYIVWVISSPYTLPTPSPPSPSLASRQNLFCP
jgi:hypothetical protein